MRLASCFSCRLGVRKGEVKIVTGSAVTLFC